MEHLAVVTGASSGIGFELAKYAAEKDYDLIIAADEPQIQTAAEKLRAIGAQVIAVQADLATREGVDKLYDAIRACGRPVDALLANAGHGLGGAFLDQDPNAWRNVIETNIIGTLDLIQRVGRDMRDSNEGKILITGSIAGFIPGSYQAVYNASKAFLDSFAFALRNELKDTDVTVTCLMPGATETEFFDRAGMEDTKIGAGKKDDPAGVAKTGFEAMLKGEGDVVTGWMNKLQTAFANITPSDMLAERHRKQAEPGSAQH
ncbi:MAG TPA: SDR family NAD(P)-dependent oxidoreductase [Methylocella sp.]|jgi:short-subunit dehydrogenase|nr:SDR family NAD(P)-dependent oxidoreductase [Methylocella sp.]